MRCLKKTLLNIWMSKNPTLFSLFMLGSVYATDYSNASSTGIFEPFTVCAVPENVVAIYCASQMLANVFTFSFQKCWNPTLCNLLSIPVSIYPPVRDTR